MPKTDFNLFTNRKDKAEPGRLGMDKDDFTALSVVFLINTIINSPHCHSNF